jgi:hypothetical protein
MSRDDQLALTEPVRLALLAEVQVFGKRDLETGGLLLATSSEPNHLHVLALAGSRGIVRRPYQFVISAAAVERLFGWAEECGLRVRAMVHSHGTLAAMSPTDRRHGFTVEGFTSVIVPHFAAPPEAPSAWGWWRFTSGVWRSTVPGLQAEGTAEVVVFDETGIQNA